MPGFLLAEGEIEMSRWTIMYLPKTGGKWAGKLVVTNHRVIFDPLDSKVDYSAAGIAAAAMTGSLIADELKNYWDAGTLSIPRTEVKTVSKQGRLTKQVVMTLADGQEHVFDYGLLSVNKLMSLLQS